MATMIYEPENWRFDIFIVKHSTSNYADDKLQPITLAMESEHPSFCSLDSKPLATRSS